MVLTQDNAWGILKSFTPIEQIACAIYCVKSIYTNAEWLYWASDWLEGKDRTQQAANKLIDYYTHRYSGLPYIENADRAAEQIVQAWSCSFSKIGNFNNWRTDIAIRYVKSIRPEVLPRVLLTHFICPHCYLIPEQHTSNGSCLFGAHVWKDIANAWRE